MFIDHGKTFNLSEPFYFMEDFFFQILSDRPIYRCCSCNCHGVEQSFVKPKFKSVNSRLTVAERINGRIDEACQTLSTGDIVITKIFFKEDQDKTPEKVILSSTNKVAQ